MFSIPDQLKAKIVSPAQAVACVKSGDRIYMASNCAQPITLTEALVARAPELRGVEIVHLICFGPAPYCNPEHAESFRHVALFVANNTREAVERRQADYIPVFLSDVPRLFESGEMRIDVAFVSVSLPDAQGYCSLGTSVDLAPSACRSAQTIVAEVNAQMPRTLGPGRLHISEMDFAILTDRPLPEHVDPPADDVTHAIATNVASLIDDGATLQTGIGAIPAAVWNALRDKNDLGVHTEMFGDALIQAIDRGNVTGKCKTLDPGLVVATFVFGTRALYDRLHDNHAFRFMPTEYINDPMIIGQQDNMIAVNSAIEVDLTGQVCADSIGTRIYSGIGGQVDFMRGASRSRGGKPIIAMASTACRGTVSKIVSTLRPGAGVVTSRGDVHYVVTEHGIAYLHGKSLRERKERLIAIAAPEFHDGLRESWTEKGQG